MDPSQYGHGLIGLGTVTMYGATKTPTFVQLAAEPHAGDTTITLAQPVSGWQVGDRLVLADTRQDQSTGPSQLELLSVTSISADGKVVTLAQPLLYDHLGARDGNGVLQYLP